MILHIDFDCFFVQVERKRNPLLTGIPVAIKQHQDIHNHILFVFIYTLCIVYILLYCDLICRRYHLCELWSKKVGSEETWLSWSSSTAVPTTYTCTRLCWTWYHPLPSLLPPASIPLSSLLLFLVLSLLDHFPPLPPYLHRLMITF